LNKREAAYGSKELIEYAENRLRLKNCGRMGSYGTFATVILMSFLMTFRVYGEPLMEQSLNLNESGMRFYSDLEVDLLIDEISEVAREAIERAVGEAAKAAVLAVVEREAAALREASARPAEAPRWQLEAERQTQAVTETRKAGVKNTIIAGLACLVGGLVVGIGGTLIIGGR
jgi:hypothetical protein